MCNGQLRTSCRTRTVIYSRSSLSSTSRSTDQYNYSRKLGQFIRSSHDSNWQACMRETDADRSWQAGHGKLWTSIRKSFSDEMYKEDATEGVPDWLQPFTVNLEDLERCARTFLWKRDLRFGRWCFKSGDTKMEAQYSYWLPQIPTENYSMNGRDRWIENSRTQKRISGQSPIRCRGTRSHHSVDAIRVKPKTSQETEKIFMEVFRAVAEAKSYLYGRFIRIWQVLWRIIMESSPHCSETRNCRTSCTSSKRRDISRIFAIWIECKVVVRFYEMLLLSAECPKPLGKREILIWTKIWRII